MPQQNLKPFQKMHHHYHAAARHQPLAWALVSVRCNDEHWVYELLTTPEEEGVSALQLGRLVDLLFVLCCASRTAFTLPRCIISLRV